MSTDNPYSEPAGRREGVVKWWSEPKGFGFIIPDGAGESSIFCHYNSIVGTGRRNLTNGARVAFDTVQKAKGPEAENVCPI